MELSALLAARDGLVTATELSTVMTRKQLATYVKRGLLVRVCHGVYACEMPDMFGRLAALDLMTGQRLVACMGTAAALYGFDTEQTTRTHILDPSVRIRPSRDLMVHQRVGAPLRRVDGRLVTAPAWTAVEVARQLWRPRALATLDAALHVDACTLGELKATIAEQKGRRGIVKVRELVEHADGRAESPMESEARLVFIDGDLPKPELQYWIQDLCGQNWRVDFAWPDKRVVAEYDSIEWHSPRDAMLADRFKHARLQDCGWSVVSMTVDDVRCRARELVARVEGRLERRRFAS